MIALLLGVAFAQDVATIPGRQCASFVLEQAAVTTIEGTGRVASPDRPDSRGTTPAAPTSTGRPAERVSSTATAHAVSHDVPMLQIDVMATLPDGWVPVGGGPAVVPTGRVGDTQYYEVRNYVIACEAMSTVTPVQADH